MILPIVNDLNRPFWQATQEHRLLLQFCSTCRAPWYPVSPRCPRCFEPQSEWREMSGNGTVTSFVIYRRAVEGAFEALPYCVFQVELDEGPRLISNPADIEMDDLSVGMRVSTRYREVTEDVTLIDFGKMSRSS